MKEYYVIRKVIRQGTDKKIVIIPKHSCINVGDYVLINPINLEEMKNGTCKK